MIVHKELAPIREMPEDYDEIESDILGIFKKEIYYPLLKSIGAHKKTIQNSTDDLLQAILSGQIYYSKGSFRGKFNATLTKELKKLGATWDRKHGSFSIPLSELSIEIRSIISLSQARFEETIKKIDSSLSRIDAKKIAKQLDITKSFDKTLNRVEKSFQKNIEGISIAPQVSAQSKLRISEEYTYNLDLYITDFVQKETEELRRKIRDRSLGGVRYESIVKTIKESYGVSENKAKFLARQETALMMTKYAQVRYEEAGSTTYRWQTVRAPYQKEGAPYVKGQVRHSHAILDGKIFSWSNPPLVTEPGEPARYANPGQDYGCRCVSRPIVKFYRDQK